MTDASHVSENGQAFLSSLSPGFSTLEEVELFRQQASRLGAKLRRSLRLRTPAIATLDDPEPSVAFRGVVGTVQIGIHTFDVFPKYLDEAVAGSPDVDWHAVAITMLERAMPRPVHFERDSRLGMGRRTFMEYFALSFAVALDQATVGYPISRFRTEDRFSHHASGRLLISEQIKGGFTSPGKFATAIDVLDTNNEFNQLIRWVVDRLEERVVSPYVRGKLSEAARRLPPMDRVASPPRISQRRLARQFQHYQSVFDMAVAYSEGRQAYPNLAHLEGATFVIGSEKLFELFLERALEVVVNGPKWKVKAQAEEAFAEGIQSGRKLYSKPDNVIEIDGTPTLIVDAKYKRFAESDERSAGSKPSNSDVYQMLAACSAHGCTRALLIYPRHFSGSDEVPLWEIRWWKTLGTNQSEVRIGAAAVDLTILQDLGGMARFDENLRRMVWTAVENGGSNS